MATNGGSNLTWADYAAGVGDDGKTLGIIEILDKVNEFLGDMVMVEGNTLTGHKVALRTAIPTGVWRKINKGVSKAKATNQAVEFASGVIESRSEVDELLVALAKDKASFRLRQARSHIQGMGQTLADTFLYGDVEINPERFTGLTPFYPTLASTNVITAGGSGSDNTSMWLVCWQEDSICGFFPSGLNNAKAGIEHNDKGLEPVLDANNDKFYAYVDQFRVNMGLVVADRRQAVRICNIDVSDLATAGNASDTSANLFKHAVTAKNKIFNPESGRCVWYANREVKTALDQKALDRSNALISINTDIRGDGVVKAAKAGDTMLLGYPVHRMDSLLNTETAVS